jgi:hypothetical protein
MCQMQLPVFLMKVLPAQAGPYTAIAGLPLASQILCFMAKNSR